MVIVGIGVADRLCPPDLSRYHTTSTEIRARDGTLLRAFTTRDGTWRLRTQPASVEPRYIALLRAAEDRRFAKLPGVDPFALLRAGWQWARNGRIVSGGSTLTMQVARLLEPHPRSVAGKLHDIVRALQLQRRYSDDQIMTMYLTLAPFGGNLEGVRAASLAYFGHTPDHLTDAEAALLVALPQSPARRRPDRHPARALAARNRLLARLADAGSLSPMRAAEAEAAPLGVARHPLPRIAAAFAAGLARNAAPGAIIVSSIDPGIQRDVADVIARDTASFGDHVGVAALVIDNATRAIRGVVSSRGGYLDLTTARRSPGSVLKPFIYGLAFDALILHPETLIDDTPLDMAGYAPQNFDRVWHGQVSAREALQQSLNIPALRVLSRVGPARFVARLRQTGAAIALPNGAPGLAVALGGLGISPRDVAMLYTSLANDGVVAPLQSEQSAPANQPLDRLVTPVAAYYLQSILQGSPMPDGMAPAVLTGARNIAFKTGTSYGFRDAWAAGYSRATTVVVWVGRVEGSARPGFYGRNTAAPLLFDVFGVLPSDSAVARPPPPGAIEAASAADLPIALRQLDHATAPAALLSFPPNTASVDLLRQADGAVMPVLLRARGGRLPLRWIVNGVPRSDVLPDGGRALAWTPDGPGFVHVTIIDAADHASHATFRLIEPDSD